MDLDKEAPAGEFAVYLDAERIFSRYEQGKFPEAQDILSAIQVRLDLGGGA